MKCPKCGIKCNLAYCALPLPKIEGQAWYRYATQYRCQKCGAKLRETTYD